LCDITKPPADGCYVYGLYLDGCRWDEKEMVLAEPHPKILNYKMSYIWLVPKREADIDKRKHVKKIIMEIIY
jgi:dynein heavy chain